MSRISIWRRIPLRVQGLFFNSLPLIAVLVTAVFAYFSNQQREKTELSLNRHFEMVGVFIDLQTSLLNAATGLRGYVITHNPVFLQPYAEARGLIPQRLTKARALIQTISKPTRRAERLAHLATIEDLITAQLTALAALPTADTKPTGSPALSQAEISDQILRNQPQLEEVCRQLGKFRLDEQRQLAKRLDEIRSIRQRDYTLIFLSVFIGLVSRAVALYFFHRRVVRRVRQLTENVRSIRDGTSLVHEPSGHADDIGELERELARVSEFLSDRRIES